MVHIKKSLQKIGISDVAWISLKKEICQLNKGIVEKETSRKREQHGPHKES